LKRVTQPQSQLRCNEAHAPDICRPSRSERTKGIENGPLRRAGQLDPDVPEVGGLVDRAREAIAEAAAETQYQATGR